MRPPPFAPARLTLLTGLAGLALAGCYSTASVQRGQTPVAPLAPTELAQSDVNRMATLGMRDNLDSLLRIADKLYRRNPAEWRKTSAPSRDAALRQLRQAIEQQTPWPELQGKRDIAALSLALGPDFSGDRVAAFIYASADMLKAAHGGKTEVYLLDALDAQHLYNAARNIEIAVWLLSSRRNAAGQPLLLADEISEHDRNLSFEREFGKIIGRLDLLAEVLTEKYRRAVISYVQNLLGASFVQFLPVR
ncbi:MAG: hypothetical protein ACWA6Y_07700 [Polaromonas sp.]